MRDLPWDNANRGAPAEANTATVPEGKVEAVGSSFDLCQNLCFLLCQAWRQSLALLLLCPDSEAGCWNRLKVRIPQKHQQRLVNIDRGTNLLTKVIGGGLFEEPLAH